MDWPTLRDFGEWYKEQGCPWRLPNDARVYVTETTYSICVFREGRFQVELYLQKPNTDTPEHSHRIPTLMMFLGGLMRGYSEGSTPEGLALGEQDVAERGDRAAKQARHLYNVLQVGKWHRLQAFERGGVVFILQEWPVGEKPTSATLAYHGEPMDAAHASLMGGKA